MGPAQVQPDPFFAFLPLIIMSIGIAISAGLLAKNKDRNVVLWIILGIIPIINLWCLPYIVGASNIRLERKLDSIMRKMEINEK